ncbi:MAG: prolyl oligopeptidase family serine peptidase [Solirubrobacteraceae bacterium]
MRPGDPDTDRPEVLPYGSWKTPVTSAVVVAAAVVLSDVRVDGDDVIWSEGRPAEGGRTQLVRRSRDGKTTDLLHKSQDARTAVHEYGGGAWWVKDGIVWFVAWDDQRLYRLDPATGAADPLVPEPAVPRGDRYADGDLTPDGAWIACVRERHSPDDGALGVQNEIVRLAAHRPSTPEVLVSGPDFVMSPRWNPTGDRLCWVEWNHPNMPWDGTRLCVRELVTGGEIVVAGGSDESVSEPCWQADGSLVFSSDRDGWWSLYRWSPDDEVVEPLVQVAADIGVPKWQLGQSRYALLPDGRVVFARSRDGSDALAVRLQDGTVTNLELPYSFVSSVCAAADSEVVVVAGTPTAELSVARVALDDGAGVESLASLRPARDLGEMGVDASYMSVPVPIEFPSEHGRTAFAMLYSPTNPAYAGPADELPPLLVFIHGGPTSAARVQLQLGIQYWTTRGFAVVDVNYGGSTGYGRSYRQLLRGAWGVVDVEDCIAAARWLAEQRLADPARLCIRGGSAGGFTTLAALAREDTPFAAGADYYGVADLEALARETHKFESRYLDGMIGPYPAARQIYQERSPIHHVSTFSRPLIVLQGLQDEVVPPNQSEMIVDALRGKGVPVAYLTFDGEQHGFRRAENIRQAMDAELSFYAQVFGFTLPEAEGIKPTAVDNLPYRLTDD